MVKEALVGFGETAKALLPPTTKWGYGYEKSAVAATLKEQAQAHVETLRVQGLYLPKEGRHKPIDIGVHWLLLEFGGEAIDQNGELVDTNDEVWEPLPTHDWRTSVDDLRRFARRQPGAPGRRRSLMMRSNSPRVWLPSASATEPASDTA